MLGHISTVDRCYIRDCVSIFADIVKYICPEGERYDLGQDAPSSDILLQDAQLQPTDVVEVKDEPSDFELGEQVLLSHAQALKQEPQQNLFLTTESLLDTLPGNAVQSPAVNAPLSSSQQLQQAVLKLQAVQRQNQVAQQQQQQLQLLQILQQYQQQQQQKQQQQQQQKVTLTTDQLKLLLLEYQNRQNGQNVQPQQQPAVAPNAPITNKAGITLQQLQQVSSFLGYKTRLIINNMPVKF